MGILGSVLLDGRRVMDLCVERGVSVDTFYMPANRAVFACMMDLYENRHPIDSITLTSSLTAGGKLEDVGGPLYLTRLIDRTPTVAHAGHYISIARGKECRRDVIRFARAAEAAALQEDREVVGSAGLVDAVQEEWRAVSAKSDYSPRTRRMLWEVAVDKVVEWRDRTEPDGEVFWPVPHLNDTIGLVRDDLIFLCAEPSVGKTAFAVQMGLVNARRRSPVSVHMRSVESSLERLAPRAIAHMGRVNTFSLRQKIATDADYARAMESAHALKDIPFFITDGSATIQQIRAWATEAVDAGARLLIVDNLKHIQAPLVRSDNLVQKFREVSLQLKAIRDDLRVPMLVLHHLNRDNGDMMWAKNDLRADADILLFMRENKELSVRDGAFGGACERCVVDIQVEKNRDGGSGFNVSPPLLFNKGTQTFLAYDK